MYPSLIWENNFQILTLSEGLAAPGRHNNLTNLSRRWRSRKDTVNSCSLRLLLADVHVGSLIHWIGFLLGELCSQDSMEGSITLVRRRDHQHEWHVLLTYVPDLIGVSSESIRKCFFAQTLTLKATNKDMCSNYPNKDDAIYSSLEFIPLRKEKVINISP